MNISYDAMFRYAEQVLQLMREHNIAPLPRHYSVWYSYLAEENTKLVDEVKKSIGQNVAIDENLSEYLHNKYIEVATPSDFQGDAKKMLADLLKVMSDFSGETNSYQKAMDSHVKDLENAQSDNEDVNAMIQKIMACTSKLKESGDQLNQKLAKAQEEAEILREDLAQVTSEAQRDFLTGAFNRKALDRMMDDLAAFSAHNNTPLCLLMIDIDHFKKFNDTFGHLIGDEVLKMVAMILTNSLKGKDIVARFGGEEFAVLLPSTPIEGAMIVAEMLRKAISSKELRRRDNGELVGKITASIGVSSYRAGVDTIPSFIKRADEALYRSKGAGRNCVTREA